MDRLELAAIRDARKMTQQQMADELGLSRRQYIDIESGAVEMRGIHKLAIERLAMDYGADLLDLDRSDLTFLVKMASTPGGLPTAAETQRMHEIDAKRFRNKMMKALDRAK